MARLVTRTHEGGFRIVILSAALVWAAPDGVFAQDVETRPWSEILLVVGHDIGLSLPDGYIEGKAVAVTPEALDVDVRSTSNTAAYPVGRATIARTLITVIRLRKNDGRAPRAATQTIGQSAAFAGLAGLGARGIGGSLKSAGVLVGASALGAAVGRRLDNRQVEILIRIAPEPGTGAAPDPNPSGGQRRDNTASVRPLKRDR